MLRLLPRALFQASKRSPLLHSQLKLLSNDPTAANNTDLVNHILTSHLQDQLASSAPPGPETESQLMQLAAIHSSNATFFKNLINYYECSYPSSDFQGNQTAWLLQHNHNTYNSILLLLFYGGPCYKAKEIYTQLAEQIAHSHILADLVVATLQGSQIELSEQQVDELRQIQGDLRPYAQLFLSKVIQPDLINQTCHPLLLSEFEPNNRFVLDQLIKQVETLPLVYCAGVLRYIQKCEPSSQVFEFMRRFYQLRVDKKTSKEFDLRVITLFIKAACQFQVFNEAAVLANLLNRCLSTRQLSYRASLKSIFYEAARIYKTDYEVFSKFERIFNQPEYSNTKAYLELELSKEISAEQMMAIRLMNLSVPENFFGNYLRRVQPTQKWVKLFVGCILQSNQFWQTPSVNQDTMYLIENWVSRFPSAYLGYVDLRQQPNAYFVQYLINNSANVQLYQFIRKNFQVLSANTIYRFEFPVQFANALQEEIIRFAKNKQSQNQMETLNIVQLTKAFDIVGKYEDQKELLEFLEKHAQSMPAEQFAAMIKSSSQLRTLYQSQKWCKTERSEASLSQQLIEKPGQGLQKLVEGERFNNLHEILEANSKAQGLGRAEQQRAKVMLLKQLAKLDTFPNANQAYELVMGFRATDFEPLTYLVLLKQIQSGLASFDYHHITKLVSKLIHTRQAHPGIVRKSICMVEHSLRGNLSEVKGLEKLVRLTHLLKRLVPELDFEVSEQHEEEGIFAEQILKRILNKEWQQVQFVKPFTQKYIEFYPLFYDNYDQNINFQLQLQLALQAYQQQQKFLVNPDDLQRELNRSSITHAQLFRLAALITMLPSERQAQFTKRIYKELIEIDIEHFYTFEDDLVTYMKLLQDLYPESTQLRKKFEVLVKKDMVTFEVPTIQYLLTESLLTIRTISQLEDACLL